MTEIFAPSPIRLVESGLPGEGWASVARRTGAFGVVPTDTDAEALDKFANWAIQENPGFEGPAGPPGANVMAIGTLAEAPSIAVPAGTGMVAVSGGEAVGDDLSGMQLAESDAVDATYVASEPETSFVDDAGRGFKQSRYTPSFATAALGHYLGAKSYWRPGQTAIDAIAKTGVCKTAIIGDSIAYDSQNDHANSMSELILDVMESLLPMHTHEMADMTLPGRSLSDYQRSDYVAPTDFTILVEPYTPKRINTTHFPLGQTDGKSLIDHVKDIGAHFLFVQLAENDGNDSYALAARMDNLLAIVATWPIVPEIILITPLVPETTPADQRGKQGQAEFYKYLAVDRGLLLADANKFWQLIRRGSLSDYAPKVVEKNFEGWGDPDKYTSTGTLTLSGNILSGTGIATRVNVFAKDIDHYFKIKRGETFCTPVFNFRSRDEGSNYSIQVNCNDGIVRFVYRDAYHGDFEAFTPPAVGDYMHVRVKARGSRFKLFIDNQLVMTQQLQRGLDFGWFSFGFGEGSGTIEDPLITYSPMFKACPDMADRFYMTGDLLHHPTPEAMVLCYHAAIKGAIEQMVDTFRAPFVSASPADTSDYTTVGDFIPNYEVEFMSGFNQQAEFLVEGGYLNSGATSVLLTLQIDGVGVKSWYLKPTGADTENHEFSFKTALPVTAGKHVARLFATAGATFNGENNLRQISVTARPI